MTLDIVCDELLLYLDSVKNYSPRTILAYKLDFANLKKLCGADTDIADISLQDLRYCIANLSQSNLEATSINRFISAIRTLYNYCYRLGYIKHNFAFELKSLKRQQHLPNFMTNIEVDTLCKAPTQKPLLWSLRDRAIFEVFYSTGCRVSELYNLKIGDISQDFESALVLGKGGKQRYVYFAKDAKQWLKDYLRDREKRFGDYKAEDSVFVSQQGKPLSISGFAFILSTYTGPQGTNKHENPHAFRHTFATALLNEGADIRVVQEFLGHASISTTQRYTHVSRAHLIDIYNKTHPHSKK